MATFISSGRLGAYRPRDASLPAWEGTPEKENPNRPACGYLPAPPPMLADKVKQQELQTKYEIALATYKACMARQGTSPGIAIGAVLGIGAVLVGGFMLYKNYRKG